jgi:hypothetical protein
MGTDKMVTNGGPQMHSQKAPNLSKEWGEGHPLPIESAPERCSLALIWPFAFIVKMDVLLSSSIVNSIYSLSKLCDNHFINIFFDFF